MTFQDAVRNVLSNYANFAGRARRSEYWWFYLFTVIVYVVAALLDAAIGARVVTYLVVLAVVVPSLAVGSRRLHDTGRSGWWQLIAIVPLIGAIVLLVFFVSDSQPDNRFGPSPKGQLAGSGYPPQGYGKV